MLQLFSTQFDRQLNPVAAVHSKMQPSCTQIGDATAWAAVFSPSCG
jgi:hypothetical protein